MRYLRVTLKTRTMRILVLSYEASQILKDCPEVPTQTAYQISVHSEK